MDGGVLCVHLILQRDKTIRSMSVITLWPSSIISLVTILNEFDYSGNFGHTHAVDIFQSHNKLHIFLMYTGFLNDFDW